MVDQGVTLTDAAVLQWFGANPANYRAFGLAGHDGVDLRTVNGQQLYAPVAGIIRGPFWDEHGWGINLAVEMEDGGRIYLCHLSDVQASKDGDFVAPGTPICLAGMTGNTDGPHVHVTYHPCADYSEGLYRGRVDPLPFLLNWQRGP